MPCGKCVQNGGFVVKFGYLWRNLGVFVAKLSKQNKKETRKARVSGVNYVLLLHPAHALRSTLCTFGALAGTLFEFHLAEAEGHTD